MVVGQSFTESETREEARWRWRLEAADSDRVEIQVDDGGCALVVEMDLGGPVAQS